MCSEGLQLIAPALLCPLCFRGAAEKSRKPCPELPHVDLHTTHPRYFQAEHFLELPVGFQRRWRGRQRVIGIFSSSVHPLCSVLWLMLPFAPLARGCVRDCCTDRAESTLPAGGQAAPAISGTPREQLLLPGEGSHGMGYRFSAAHPVLFVQHTDGRTTHGGYFIDANDIERGEHISEPINL